MHIPMLANVPYAHKVQWPCWTCVPTNCCVDDEYHLRHSSSKRLDDKYRTWCLSSAVSHRFVDETHHLRHLSSKRLDG